VRFRAGLSGSGLGFSGGGGIGYWRGRDTIAGVYLVILLAAAAILGGVVVVAMGRGGEMALFDRDRPVKILRLETPGEVATLPLPFGLIGYQARATGEALVAAANLLARRDAEIAALRREIWRLGGDDQMVVSDAEVPGVPAPEFAAPEFAAPSSAFGAPSSAGQSDVDEGDDPAEEAPVASDLGQDQSSRS
jgi:hypothetical protein